MTSIFRPGRWGRLVCVLVATATGCAWIPQTATLKVTPKVLASAEGRGVGFAVEVLDGRMTTILGYRGMDSQNAAITSKQNVAMLVRQALVDGFNRKGFRAIPYEGEPGHVLTVELRKLEYTTDMDYWKGIVMTEAVLNASMKKDGVRFEQVYSGRRKDTTVEAPRARTNERLLNEALSESVENLLSDPNLVRFIAE